MARKPRLSPADVSNVIQLADHRRPQEPKRVSIISQYQRPGETLAQTAHRVGQQMADNVNSGRVDLSGLAAIMKAPDPAAARRQHESDQARLERIVRETSARWNSGEMTRDVKQETRILERLAAFVERLEERAGGAA